MAAYLRRRGKREKPRPSEATTGSSPRRAKPCSSRRWRRRRVEAVTRWRSTVATVAHARVSSAAVTSAQRPPSASLAACVSAQSSRRRGTCTCDRRRARRTARVDARCAHTPMHCASSDQRGPRWWVWGFQSTAPLRVWGGGTPAAPSRPVACGFPSCGASGVPSHRRTHTRTRTRTPQASVIQMVLVSRGGVGLDERNLPSTRPRRADLASTQTEAPSAPCRNPHPGLTPNTIHRAPVGQGPEDVGCVPIDGRVETAISVS